MYSTSSLRNLKSRNSVKDEKPAFQDNSHPVGSPFVVRGSSSTRPATAVESSPQVKTVQRSSSRLSQRNNNLRSNSAKAEENSRQTLTTNNPTAAELRVKKMVDSVLVRLRRNDKSLVEIDFGDKKIEDVGAQALAAALENNQTVKNINLRGNQIGIEGIRALSSALISNQTIQQVNLSHNQIGDDGAKLIASTLANNQSIKSLNLMNNRIGDAGVVDLELSLIRNWTVTALYLANNEVKNSVGNRALSSIETTVSRNKNYAKELSRDNSKRAQENLDREVEHIMEKMDRLKLEESNLERQREEFRQQQRAKDAAIDKALKEMQKKRIEEEQQQYEANKKLEEERKVQEEQRRRSDRIKFKAMYADEEKMKSYKNKEELFARIMQCKEQENEPHEILGVPADATNSEIIQAYKGIVLVVHPDKNPDTADKPGVNLKATQVFQIVGEAFEQMKSKRNNSR